jgi:hypothetical protein
MIGRRARRAGGAMIDILKADLKQAMLRRDAPAVSTLRLLISQFQYARIQEGRDLTEDDAISLLKRAVKTRREAIEQYEKGGRRDLADKERAEIAVVERYLPQAMSPEEMEQAVGALLAELQITQRRDLGRAMKEFMARYGGRVDGKAANALIASRLR